MPNRQLTIDNRYVPEEFQALVSHMPASQVIREASCDCHETNPDWQRNANGDCLPHAFLQGTQKPKWLVISCMDSRFPIELVLGIGAHKICNIRVAGGKLKEYDPHSAAWYSLNLALQHFKTIQGIAIIGHAACGASYDLISHFSAATNPQDMTPLQRHIAASYTDADRNRALAALEINRSSTDHGTYLGSAFRNTSRTPTNAATLLGLSLTEELIKSHLQDMGINLPTCTMMVSIDPKHPSTPLALLVQQPGKVWENVLVGTQPDIQANMHACPRQTPAAPVRGIIPIVPIAS